MSAVRPLGACPPSISRTGPPTRSVIEGFWTGLAKRPLQFGWQGGRFGGQAG